MSRIGKLPVEIPAGVKVVFQDNQLTVTGPRGTLVKAFNSVVSIQIEHEQIRVIPVQESRFANAMTGTARSIINAMVIGVTQGYSKQLVINGVGFKARNEGGKIVLNLGYSHEIVYNTPKGIIIEITENTKLKIDGIDKQVVGQVAADIYHFYKVEPYKGKGVTIVGQFVYRKEGKKTA